MSVLSPLMTAVAMRSAETQEEAMSVPAKMALLEMDKPAEVSKKKNKKKKLNSSSCLL